MSPLQDAIDSHNQGVQRLSSALHRTSTTECYSEAIGLFRHAMQRIHTVLRPTHTATALPTALLRYAAAVLPNVQEKLTVCTTVSEHRPMELFVFHTPIQFTMDIHSNHSWESRYALVQHFCQTLVFNMATAYHELGMATGCDAPMRKARDLYRILVRQLHKTPMNGTKDDTLFCLALNNLACLYYEVDDYPASQACVHHLYHVLDVHPTSKYILCTEWEEIQLNLLYLRRAPATARAA